MMSKDQWIAEHERILENYASRMIDKGEAETQLADLGLIPSEIKDDLDACDS